MATRPGDIHRKIVELLIANPLGLTSGDIRAKLKLQPNEQAQLDRRRRDLKKWFNIEKGFLADGRTVYIYRGERAEPFAADTLDLKTRAVVFGMARGKCQMCGRTIAEHGITLVVDHKTPRDWGGPTELGNLWAVCQVNDPIAVYALKDPRSSPALPFYMGKGAGTRSHDHLAKPDDIRKGQKIKEIEASGAKVLVSRLVDSLSEQQAMRLEAELISAFGTVDTGGLLTNSVLPSGLSRQARTGVVVPSGVEIRGALPSENCSRLSAALFAKIGAVTLSCPRYQRQNRQLCPLRFKKRSG